MWRPARRSIGREGRLRSRASRRRLQLGRKRDATRTRDGRGHADGVAGDEAGVTESDVPDPLGASPAGAADGLAAQADGPPAETVAVDGAEQVADVEGAAASAAKVRAAATSGAARRAP